MTETYPATIVTVIDDYRVAINRGAAQGVKRGQRFLVYSVSDEEIIDPETKKSLGRLEIVKGTGTVEHVQEQLSTIRTDRRERPEKRTIRKTTGSPLWSFTMPEEETIYEAGEQVPFDDPKVGDRARPI